MNARKAFRKSASKFASDELGLGGDQAEQFVDIVEKEADTLSASMALNSGGGVDKSAASEDDDALTRYLYKQAGDLRDEVGKDELEKAAQSFYTDPARGLPAAMQQSGLPAKISGPLLGKITQAAKGSGKGKLLAALATLLAGGGAAAYGLSGGGGGAADDDLMSQLGEYAPEAAGAAGGGLAGERIANALGGDSLMRALGGGGGAIAGGIGAGKLEELLSQAQA